MTSPPLTRTLSLRPGETPASYVSRLAAHHGTLPRDFCSDFGMHWPFLCSGRDDQLQQLSRLTGAALPQLQFWSPVKLKNGRYRVGGTIASVGVFRRTAIRLCPICICEALDAAGSSEPFQLLEWCVTCLNRCEAHGVALSRLPPATNSHEAYDLVAQVSRNKRKVYIAAQRAEPLPESPFETYVRQRIHHGAHEDWLHCLELAHLHRACLTLGLTLAGPSKTRLTDIDSIGERHACDTGFAVLAQGPEALTGALDRLRTRQRSNRPWFSADLGHFHAWLRTVQDMPALDELTGVVRQYIFRHYPAKPDKAILGALPDAISSITFDEARMKAKLGVGFLKRLLAHVDGVPLQDVRTRPGITLPELERVTTFWGTLCSLKEAGGLLGIAPERVKELIALGVLSHFRFGSALRYPVRADIANLLEAVTALPMVQPFSESLPLRTFCATKGISLSQVIANWRRGDLEGEISRGEGQRLQALRIHVSASGSKAPLRLDDDPSLNATARYLRINVASVRKLRDMGLLHQVRKRNADTNFLHSFITRSSISAFEQDYVTLGKLAERNGVAPIHLASRLDRAGFPTIDTGGTLVRVYHQDMLPTDLLVGI